MQILTTKLSVPALRSRSIARSHLVQRLNQGKECALILISAPAGYGKSTLLSTWLSQLRYPSTWLSIDENDNDVNRFLTYLTAALRALDPSITEETYTLTDNSSQPEIDAILTSIINQLAKRVEPFWIILDDYHMIENGLVHRGVNFLLNHRPASMHLVIATRADPPLQLARWRSRSELVEIRMADLRFTTQETTDFMTHTMELSTTPEDVNRLQQRTEGWVAGLQMAALSMQNVMDVSSFLAAFTGSHHFIYDYLLEEILAKQSQEIKHFLLYTSVLDLMSAPLCDFLFENDDTQSLNRPSSAILEGLYHANLFVIPLDHEQRWYRYHPLFAELLRGYLLKINLSNISTLHKRASLWFETHGMISDAIRHAIASQDWEQIVRLVSANVFALLEQNELNAVSHQIDHLIHEKTLVRPWLLVGRAWLAAYTGQLDSVESILIQAETEVGEWIDARDKQTVRGHIAVIRAYTNWIGDNRDIAIQAAQEALEWLPEDEHLIRCQAATLCGLTDPDFDMRRQSFELALEYAKDCPASHVTIFAYGCWAWHLTMRGKLHDAYAACLEAIRLSKTVDSIYSSPTLSHIYTTMSVLLLEWNDPERAIQYAKEAVDLARHWEQADALHFALNQYGCVLFATGKVDQAWDVQRQTWQVARQTSPWFEQISLSQDIEWQLSKDNIAGALDRLRQEGIQFNEPVKISLDDYKSLSLPILFVQIYLAQKKYAKALALSIAIQDELGQNQIGYYLIRILIWQAIAYYGLKQAALAQEVLVKALEQYEPEGYLRVFCTEGKKVLPILRMVREKGIMADTIDRILAAYEPEAMGGSKAARSIAGTPETLSKRELDVLRLLAQGCPDKKIAQMLVIAPETVHKHLKNIYGKLDVHNRTEAVLRAHELELI